MALRSFGEGALLAEVYGSGPPQVLALHGWGRRGRDFASALRGLSAIAPDLPGFGASPAPKEAIGADGYADIIGGVLDEFDSPPVIVGHSFGGRIAVCLAARQPDRVGPLVLTGVPLIRRNPGRKPALGFRLARWANRVGIYPDDRMERLRREHGSADYRAATGVMRDILVKVINESYEEQLRHVLSPVFMIWGSRDADVPVAVAEEASLLLATSHLQVLEDVGHLVPTQAPEALSVAIRELIP